MFNLGWTEVALVIGVAVLIFGPKKIPELGSALGKTLRGFKEEIATAPEDPALDTALDAYDEAEDADIYR
jgi:sec-independent protein translocase protein TatA